MFAWAIVFAGLAVLCLSLHRLLVTSVDRQWIVLAILAAVSGFAVLRLHTLPATFSFGDAFSFAALFLYGPAAGAVTAALDSLASDLRLRQLSPLQLVFNVAAPALSMWIAGTMVFQLVGLPLPAATPMLGTALFAVAVTACLFFGLESALVATAIALEKNLSPSRVWRDLFSLWLDPIVGAYVGFLFAFYSHDLGMTFLLLVVPIPLILYYTFSTWLGRVDDDIRHLATLNRSYRSMVEALASAVEAKDHVTHGHVLRVQRYCLALARHLGITDAAELNALEAAAVLHDVGKIGVPERILNKPGRLTAHEFEEMKKHVTIGAQILSTIDFPYPILPVVRHHHENWDGTGYPDGLAGEAIPIGARILMVADCFDALTSDRPYRRRLSIREAFEILKSRRGTMYDLRIVDAFVRLQPKIEVPPETEVRSVALRSTDQVPSTSLQSAAGTARQQGLVRLVAEALPGWLCVLYECDPSTDMVVVRNAQGSGAELVRGHAVACGAGVSGWVVASGDAINDCDGRLDLGPLAETIGCPSGVLECTSVPVRIDGVAGALTVYKTCADAHVTDGTIREVLCQLVAFESADALATENSLVM